MDVRGNVHADRLAGMTIEGSGYSLYWSDILHAIREAWQSYNSSTPKRP